MPNMSLACLVCHSVESPSPSFRSCSISSSDNDGRCSSITNCLTGKASLPQLTANVNLLSTSKVTPQPTYSSNLLTGPPRLVRSRAVRRDLVRDWNFDEVIVERQSINSDQKEGRLFSSDGRESSDIKFSTCPLFLEEHYFHTSFLYLHMVLSHLQVGSTFFIYKWFMWKYRKDMWKYHFPFFILAMRV